MSQALMPLHSSVRKRIELGNGPIRPVGMTRIALPSEMREGLERIALSIFTDMTNAGASFQDILSAVYMSGLQHGAALGKEKS